MDRIIYFKSEEVAFDSAELHFRPKSTDFDETVGVVLSVLTGYCLVRAVGVDGRFEVRARIAEGAKSDVGAGDFVQVGIYSRKADGSIEEAVVTKKLCPAFNADGGFWLTPEMVRAIDRDEALGRAKESAGRAAAKAFGGLDSPIKRMGLVILMIGGLLVAVSLVQVFSYAFNSQRAIEMWLDALLFQGRAYDRFPMAAWGGVLLVTGLLLSSFFDRTLGRLWSWIKLGR